MPSISLCMIAKNEEDCIGRAIQSVLSLVVEVIVVDTGSSDKTPAIAEELGARVHTFEWNGDFSAPRNLSLQKASGDWILVLDADEGIPEQDHGALRQMTGDKSICWEFMQRHYTPDHRRSNFLPVRGEYPQWEQDQSGYFESNCVRMFPNGAGIEYRGRLHELVEFSIAELGRHHIVRTHVRIHHYGQLPSVQAKKNKTVLYTPLGELHPRRNYADAVSV
jgi:O-antigen biosynthesis protein